MANSARGSKNKRKALVQNGAYSKKKKTTVDEKIGNKSTQNEESSRNEVNFKVEMMKKFEEEFKCNICTEFFIKPTVLSCSHTFCESCIAKWKKHQDQCPICRDRMESQIRVLALDIYIEKVLELLLSPEQMKSRAGLIKEREQIICQIPRRSQRLKNRAYVTVSTPQPPLEAIDEPSSFHLRALIDEVLHLADHFTYD